MKAGKAILLIGVVVVSSMVLATIQSAFLGVFLSAEDLSPWHLSFWTGLAVGGLFGAVVCFLVARKIGLEAWWFAVCGFVWWNLTLPILGVYRFVESAGKKSRYNYYARTLGLSVLVLYMFAMFLAWFFSAEGGNVPWQ